MQLTEKEIKDFQKIHLKTFGYAISREEAVRSGAKLIRFLKLLYEPPVQVTKKPP